MTGRFNDQLCILQKTVQTMHLLEILYLCHKHAKRIHSLSKSHTELLAKGSLININNR